VGVRTLAERGVVRGTKAAERSPGNGRKKSEEGDGRLTADE